MSKAPLPPLEDDLAPQPTRQRLDEALRRAGIENVSPASLIASCVGLFLVAGLVMAAELENAKKVMDKAAKPFTAIMGGAKISDKILIIEQLLELAVKFHLH